MPGTGKALGKRGFSDGEQLKFVKNHDTVDLSNCVLNEYLSVGKGI